MCIDNASRYFFPQFLDYKGNSSPSKPITLESVENKTNAEQSWSRGNRSTSTNVTNNDHTARNHVKFLDETEDHPYKDAIFRVGKV